MSLVRMSIRGALATPPPVPDHLLPGLKRAAVGCLIAPGGTGKSAFALQTGVELALGLPVCGGLFPAPPQPRRTAFITAEDDEEEVARRLHAIVEHLHASGATDSIGLSRDQIAGMLEERLSIFPCPGKSIALVRQGKWTKFCRDLRDLLHGHDLAFLDTVSRLHDGDENSTNAVALLIEVVQWVAVQANVALVMLHHVGKLAEREKEADSSIAGRGAIVFRDNVRWLANLFPHATQAGAADAYLRFQITKANQIPKQPGKFLERLPGGVLQLRTTLEHRSKARA